MQTVTKGETRRVCGVWACLSAFFVLSAPVMAGSMCRRLVQGDPECGLGRTVWLAEGACERFHRRDLCPGIYQSRRSPLVGQDCGGLKRVSALCVSVCSLELFLRMMSAVPAEEFYRSHNSPSSLHGKIMEWTCWMYWRSHVLSCRLYSVTFPLCFQF